MTERFRLSRAGVLNVWQYDDQVFEFADGRLLLRGANGAGKSKTLEMLLPFVIDGDKARMTASARHHTSLLWLMLDGYGGQNRAGYLWVEFSRGDGETITCGVGIRASQSARAATAWFFTVPVRIGDGGLLLEDAAGPLGRDRLRAEVEARGGQLFDSARPYKQHVGRLLFGLEPGQYDDLLRLLYWLRQPQIGEDIEPARLAEQLVQALPALDDDAIRAAGDTFDELAAFGEQLDRRRRSADGVAALASVYADYAREVLRSRGVDVLDQHRERTRWAREVGRLGVAVEELTGRKDAAEGERDGLRRERDGLGARLEELRQDPTLRTERELVNRRRLAGELADRAAALERAAERATLRATTLGDRVRRDAGLLSTDVARHAVAAHGLTADLVRLGAPAGLAVDPELHQPDLSTPADADRVSAALGGHTAEARAARPAVGALLAALQVVDDARNALVRAVADRARVEEKAVEAEQRAEEERGLLADARRAAAQEESAYATALGAWRVDPRAVPVQLPAELSAGTVGSLARRARVEAAEPLRMLRDEEARAAAAVAVTTQDLGDAERRRAAVVAKSDPAPIDPAWSRDPRDSADGAPLWRLVDFADTLDEPARAGLEAAMEASGLLDAWVRTDGTVLDPGRRDVVLPMGPRAAGPTLAAVLRADPPVGGPVPAEVVHDVLQRVGWTGDDADASVFPDGRWRLGPLTGRATKITAQYIGATARAAERRRRLAELGELIAALTAQRDSASAAEQRARSSIDSIEDWIAEAPAGGALQTAWTRLEERTDRSERADRRAEGAAEQAVAARSAEAARRTALDDLAAAHGLPVDAQSLAGRREELRALDGALHRHADGAGPLRARLSRWAEDAAGWAADAEAAVGEVAQATEQRARAETAEAAAEELEAAVGATLRELQERITAFEGEERQIRMRIGDIGRRIETLLGEIGGAQRDAVNAAARLSEREPLLAGAVSALAALADTPGLLDSGSPRTDPGPPAADLGGVDQHAALALARGYRAGMPVPGPVLAFARRVAGLSPPVRAGTETAVYAAWQEAASGPPGDNDPRVAEVGGALTVVGRDDSGEHPIGELAGRLAEAVARDEELLTDRERRLFEEHILGDLGESLRLRRLEARELVTAMNELLRGVTTSQGIHVQLRWDLRDDVAAEARRAVQLLGTPVGALLPDERHDLRDALHRLIEAARLDAPEDSYAEHLTRALDYRRWFAFRIRYTRPENAGTWHDLHRRSPLSQGEQKVVCYLPLFAAAAAHFSSLAGAAPHSPRFVLLDDAFPKIDIRTHPLLFGLLVQLDLDFVITSERLWGDHATVPSLAIYEALRDPNERGVAQYRHVWDGQRLLALGG